MDEYEVITRMSRTARFRTGAASTLDAAARVLDGADGVRSMQDLDDELMIDGIITVTKVAPGEDR